MFVFMFVLISVIMFVLMFVLMFVQMFFLLINLICIRDHSIFLGVLTKAAASYWLGLVKRQPVALVNTTEKMLSQVHMNVRRFFTEELPQLP